MTREHEEERVLHHALTKIDSMYERLSKVPIYRGDDFTQQVLEGQRHSLRESLKSAKVEPYFARLDFLDFEDPTKKVLYIGKVGIHDEEEDEPLVIDWRAPVASLFYSFNGSEDDVYYDSPEGIVEGEIKLKRNVVIRSRELKRVVDSYVEGQDGSGGDEFLLYKLGEQKDNKLKDIVSTIQTEQNTIIRADVRKALVIQGAAGSGKTTVALHRLAFLLYEYREKLRAERMMIFAPNAMFLDYIAQVLPELGVGNIRQSTYVSWGMTILNDTYSVESTTDRMFTRFEGSESQEKQKEIIVKGSLSFRRQLKTHLDHVLVSTLPNKDFIPWSSKSIPQKTILKWIQEDFSNSAPVKQRERLQARLKRWVEIEVKAYEDEKERKSYKAEGLKAVRAYMNGWKKPNVLKIYERFLIEQGLNRSKDLQSGLLAHEDLAPILFIHQELHGIEKESRFDHLVLDEAQDLSPFTLSILKDNTRAGGLTILGDLAQGIHGEEGILSWDSFVEVLDHKVAYVQMEKSYRSTMEIIDYSNHILQKVSNHPPTAKPVFRSGEPVQVMRETSEALFKWLERVQDYESAAILCRSIAESEKIYQQLVDTPIEVTLIRANDKTYKGGVSILPIYLAKGFEFDAVHILNVTPEFYPNDDMHCKLLYVGCTRALHSLTLSYPTIASEIIQDDK